MNDDDFKLLKGFALGQTKERTDICDCRVAFATEKILIQLGILNGLLFVMDAPIHHEHPYFPWDLTLDRYVFFEITLMLQVKP